MENGGGERSVQVGAHYSIDFKTLLSSLARLSGDADANKFRVFWVAVRPGGGLGEWFFVI